MIVQIWEDEWMPVDAAGNRAEIIASSNSTVARSNWGRPLIPYFAGAARDVRKRLLSTPGLPSKINVESLMLADDNVFNYLYNTLLEFYAIVSPKQYYWFCHKVTNKEKRAEHLAKCLIDKIYPFMPVDNPINDIDAVLQLEERFPQTYGPVTYRGIGGVYVTTVDAIRIVPMYFMLLEKIADDGSSANMGKLQHHGLLASQTKTEKYAQNYRPNHTRNFGEAEMRLTVFYARSVIAAAEIHDRNNNPDTMHSMAYTLLRHPTPTNIDCIVDRKKIPLGGTRPLQYLQHFMQANGARISYMSEREAFELGLKERFDVK